VRERERERERLWVNQELKGEKSVKANCSSSTSSGQTQVLLPDGRGSDAASPAPFTRGLSSSASLRLHDDDDDDDDDDNGGVFMSSGVREGGAILSSGLRAERSGVRGCLQCVFYLFCLCKAEMSGMRGGVVKLLFLPEAQPPLLV